MKIFFKYIAKCMTEKKGRLILLILAIALSTGLFVTISGAVKIGVKTYEKPLKERYEEKEISINTKNENPFFAPEDINADGVSDIQYDFRVFGTKNSDDTIYVNVNGRENKNIERYDFSDGNLDDFEGEKCIISKRVSEEQDLNVGDKLEMFVAGEKTSYKVAAVTSNDGLFYNDNKTSFQIIVPYKYLSEKYNMEGKYNNAIANKTKDDIQDSIKEFNDNNSNFEAQQLFNEEAEEEQMASFTTVLYAMLIIVVFMSAIIIYGTFKLTITERLSVIGTFLSCGATNGVVEKILLLESVCYAVLGGIVGDIFGYGGLYLVNYLVSPGKEYGIISEFSPDVKYFAFGIIFALVFSVLSALIPVLKIRKLQVKEVILNNVNISMHIGWKKFIIGAVILIISGIVNFIDSNSVNGISILFIFLSAAGLILMYPKIIDIVTNLIYKVLRGRSRVLSFAFNNLRTSKVLMSNITLIIISLLSIFMITSIGTSMVDMVQGAYKEMDMDVTVSGINGVNGISGESATDKLIDKLKEKDGIDNDSFLKLTYGYAEVNDNSGFTIEGVDEDKYDDFQGYLELNKGKNKELYDKFKDSDDLSIILSENANKSLNLKEGDTVSVKINKVNKDLKVLGFFDGKLYKSGYFALIKNADMYKYFNIEEADQICFKTSKDPADVKEDIKETIKDFGASASTKDELEKNNIEQNDSIVQLFSVFSYMAIIIAALGVFNNIMIGFIQRKRELAVLSSVGMNDGARNGMLLTESALSVFWSVVIAVPYSFLGLSLLSKGLKAIAMPLKVTLDLSAVPMYALAAFAIILIASLPILLKSRKLSIINELKYE